MCVSGCEMIDGSGFLVCSYKYLINDLVVAFFFLFFCFSFLFFL